LIGAPPFLAVASLSFATALLFTPAVRAIARRTRYLDHPGERKPHLEPTPLLGGVSVAAALVSGSLLAVFLLHQPVPIPAAGVWIGGLLSLVLGLVDDRRPMRPAGKLLGQLAAAIILVAWGSADGFATSHPAIAVLAVVAVVALLNAINFLDAMDGLVGSLVPVTGLGFIAIALFHGADVDLALAWGTVGAAAGFLVYNAPPAKIFLGDAGSHLLGFILAALALRAVDEALTWPHVAGLIAILSFPLFDVIFVVSSRLFERRPIQVGGVDHSTHRLGRICGRWGTMGVISLAAVLGTAVGTWIWGLESGAIATVAVACLALGYAIFGIWLGRSRPTPTFDT
jgi:UDP-GlcNAc:undecaprenyl-phosphate GlcNAc-1-phosphate transferase